ncbi:MAG: MoxR family ATPase, partial [Actinobacteria bacterium]|nr:MoxR family ATPase [Actinomycetota bacterium]
ALPQDGGAGVTTVALADGRQAGIRLRPGRPPLVTARTRTGEPIFDIDPVYRALREEFELGLAQPLGRVPGPADGLPCLTRTTWTIVRLVQGALLAGRPVFLRGPTGCGKSALARTVARLWHLPVVEFSFTGETAKSDLTASRQLRGGVTEWSMQAFLEAASEGLFVIINEYNLAYPDVHSIVNGLFDKGGRLVLPDGRTVRAHPDFRLVATGYPEGPGVKPLNEAVENRFGAVLRMDYPPAAEELAVLRFVAGERVGCAALSAAVELADIGRTILAGTWDSHLRHALSKIPPDLAAAAAERVALTTAELVTLAQAGESTDEFARWYRRGVLEGAGADATRVLTAALAGYGLT